MAVFIPKEIHVGFQKRSDTYTGKLAYVIYKDEKGTLRKEKSWNTWRYEKLEPLIEDNVPTSGFVLNKKAGGDSWGWNPRQTYVRVYDPRGFEFEITIPNLLYILENTNSIKGKGLEGEFVYGWDGTELLLIPTNAPDYQDMITYRNTLFNKNFLKTKELKEGVTYRTKDNKELVYLGRYMSYSYYSGEKKDKMYFFKDLKNGFLETRKTVNKYLIEVINEDVSNFGIYFEELQYRKEFSPAIKTEYVVYESAEKLKQAVESNSYVSFYLNGENVYIYKRNESNNIEVYSYGIPELYKKNKIFFNTYEELLEKYPIEYKKEILENGKSICHI